MSLGLSGLGSCVFMGVLSPLHPRAWATDGGQTWEFLTALTLRWCWAGVRLWEAMRPCSGVGNTVEGPRTTGAGSGVSGPARRPWASGSHAVLS